MTRSRSPNAPDQSRPGAISPKIRGSAPAIGGAPGASPARNPAITLWPRMARTGHKARPIKPPAPVTRIRATLYSPILPFSASDRAGNGLNRAAPRGKPAPRVLPMLPGLRVLLTPTVPIAVTSPQALEPRPKLLFLVTEDWYFWSHRLPVARAARDAGFEVVVASRVQDHGGPIRAEGFRLCPLPWRRRGDGILGAGRALITIAALFRRERPDIVHLVALKPVLFGGLAARLAFARGTGRPAQIAAVTGLGSGLMPASRFARLGRSALSWAVRF